LERTRVSEAMVSDQCSVASEGVLLDLLREARSNGSTLAQLLKRPEVQIEQLAPVLARFMPGVFETDACLSDQPSAPSPQAAQPTAQGRQLTTPVPNSNAEGTTRRLSAAVRNELKSVETEIKYSGYLEQQTKAIERLKRSEQRVIPQWFDYGKVSGLSREMNEKLTRVRPQTLGQASRIPGVTPAAVSLINVYIEIQARQRMPA